MVDLCISYHIEELNTKNAYEKTDFSCFWFKINPRYGGLRFAVPVIR